MKGRGITWHFSPVSVPIRTQLCIYCPVDLCCLLSVSDDSVPIFWLCDYSEGTMVFTLFFTQPSPWTGLGQCIAFLSVCLSACVCVTIFLHILLLTLNYHSPPLYASIFILLKPLSSKY